MGFVQLAGEESVLSQVWSVVTDVVVVAGLWFYMCSENDLSLSKIAKIGFQPIECLRLLDFHFAFCAPLHGLVFEAKS